MGLSRQWKGLCITMQNYKIGIGYDIHKLAEDRKLILGGIEIPYDRGLLGHSDADALIHVITSVGRRTVLQSLLLTRPAQLIPPRRM